MRCLAVLASSRLFSTPVAAYRAPTLPTRGLASIQQEDRR